MADELPDEIYKVFPDIFTARNTYDNPTSVKISIGQRWRYMRQDDEIRVYRAVTVWEDVTEEFTNG
jgi:hypothetical protein